MPIVANPVACSFSSRLPSTSMSSKRPRRPRRWLRKSKSPWRRRNLSTARRLCWERAREGCRWFRVNRRGGVIRRDRDSGNRRGRRGGSTGHRRRGSQGGNCLTQVGFLGRQMPTVLRVLRPNQDWAVQQHVMGDEPTVKQRKESKVDPEARCGERVAGRRGRVARDLFVVGPGGDAVDPQTIPGGKRGFLQADRHPQRGGQSLPDAKLHRPRLHVKVGGEQKSTSNDKSGNRRTDHVPAELLHFERP